MIPHFIIDGTIACGKTTVMEHLWRIPGIITQYEPIHEWKELLDKFYTDPKTYAHALNLKCLKDLARRDVEDTLTIPEKRIVVSERSIHSSYHIFGKLTLEQGLITEEQFQELQEEYHSYSPQGDPVYLFIDVDADVAIERMERRGRSEVLAEDKEYFYRLVDLYRKFYINLEASGARIHRIRGDANKDVVLNQVLSILQTGL